MEQYLLSIYQPDEGMPGPEKLSKIVDELDLLEQELKSQGRWVFSGGLHPPSTATVIRSRSGETLITDGPFTEGKEHLGGIKIIKAPDLDSALHWGRRLAEATTLPVEVRPLQGEEDF